LFNLLPHLLVSLLVGIITDSVVWTAEHGVYQRLRASSDARYGLVRSSDACTAQGDETISRHEDTRPHQGSPLFSLHRLSARYRDYIESSLFQEQPYCITEY